MKQTVTIFWHRRDLRFDDNAGLYRAQKSVESNDSDTDNAVLPIFIFDREILDKLPEKADARVMFIRDNVQKLADHYREMGSDLRAFYGHPLDIWKALLDEYDVKAIYVNRDYEPYAIARDKAVADLIEARGGSFHHFKDQIVFESDEVQKKAGGPYTVFTPFFRTWKKNLAERMSTLPNGEPVSYYLKPYPNGEYTDRLLQTKDHQPVPTLDEMGFERADDFIPPDHVTTGLIKNYDKTRNYPNMEGTTRLSVHLRHGTISIREKVRKALALNDTFVKELVFRDFYSNILQSFPHVVDAPFRPEYADIPWRNDEAEFKLWCAGKTGVPIVDAGMRQLNESGWMHNRVRMIVASYLTKHLLIDWRWGEGYFADKLLDYELASNNGGWQWAAGCGTDAQPYFRIFNYDSQQKKFDAKYEYVKEWVPEYGTPDYPAEPLIEHKVGRERALDVYKTALTAARE
ncbi:cryptochrome/photolyase family protein [Neolewinella antarctica]|uniref:Deoxyribodipyrimidine photo-lyase n=1 Tax=Neolewinella antarctica TaxID=442734 RepID=A0ABX0XD54_9BACT|nr:deoxyribodipyrimidine photo-lyase [Neolewinella antarctica]NJC27220.1 deoxyribodipyrimidine photo-lyase [Neolewinella antarctica]